VATCTLLKWEPRLQAQLATGRPGVSSAGTGRPHQIWSFSHGPGGWACCLDTRPMGGWASIPFFCSGRAGGRRDFAVENRVGVGGRPGTPGPVGGPDCKHRRNSDTGAHGCESRIALTSKVATISHGPSVRHRHARWASREETDS